MDELPTSLNKLQAHEGALLDILVSIHYQLEDVKSKLEHPGVNKNELIGKRFQLAEKKRLFESRLEKARNQIKEIQGQK